MNEHCDAGVHELSQAGCVNFVIRCNCGRIWDDFFATLLTRWGLYEPKKEDSHLTCTLHRTASWESNGCRRTETG